MTTYCVGRDVPSKQSAFVIEDEGGNVIGQGEVPTTPDGFSRPQASYQLARGTQVALESRAARLLAPRRRRPSWMYCEGTESTRIDNTYERPYSPEAWTRLRVRDDRFSALCRVRPVKAACAILEKRAVLSRRHLPCSPAPGCRIAARLDRRLMRAVERVQEEEEITASEIDGYVDIGR